VVCAPLRGWLLEPLPAIQKIAKAISGKQMEKGINLARGKKKYK